jgi:hypothetical protein
MSAESRKRSPSPNRPVRVWAEAGVTIPIGEEPYISYIKYTFGREGTAKSDDPADIKRAERKLYQQCENLIAERAEKLAALVEKVREELG